MNNREIFGSLIILSGIIAMFYAGIEWRKSMKHTHVITNIDAIFRVCQHVPGTGHVKLRSTPDGKLEALVKCKRNPETQRHVRLESL